MAFFAPVFEAARVFLAGVDSLSAASFFFRAVARLVVLPAEPFFADEAFEEALLRAFGGLLLRGFLGARRFLGDQTVPPWVLWNAADRRMLAFGHSYGKVKSLTM